jgi:hypothetical protein
MENFAAKPAKTIHEEFAELHSKMDSILANQIVLTRAVMAIGDLTSDKLNQVLENQTLLGVSSSKLKRPLPSGGSAGHK